MKRVALVLALLAGAAYAEGTATVTYRTGKKESLELIAAEYYGDRDYGVFIAVENHLKKSPAAYTRLKIPVSREITTAKGDTFASLAKQYLGDDRRAPFLADYNSMAVDESLATGTAVTVPFQVTYVSDTGETLAQIASRFYGDTKRADLLKRYNFLDSTAVDKGESIDVPALAVRVRPSKLPALDTEAQDRRRQLAKITNMARTTLPDALAAYAQGDFTHVRSILEPFADQLEYLDSNTAVTLGLLLGKAHLAFDDRAGAVKTFQQIHERKSAFKVRAYDESPKVVDAWKQAGGDVER
jgi:LysM repeat protein